MTSGCTPLCAAVVLTLPKHPILTSSRALLLLPPNNIQRLQPVVHPNVRSHNKKLRVVRPRERKHSSFCGLDHSKNAGRSRTLARFSTGAPRTGWKKQRGGRKLKPTTRRARKRTRWLLRPVGVPPGEIGVTSLSKCSESGGIEQNMSKMLAGSSGCARSIRGGRSEQCLGRSPWPSQALLKRRRHTGKRPMKESRRRPSSAKEPGSFLAVATGLNHLKTSHVPWLNRPPAAKSRLS